MWVVDRNKYFGQINDKYYWVPDLGVETAFEGIWPKMASSPEVFKTKCVLKF